MITERVVHIFIPKFWPFMAQLLSTLINGCYLFDQFCNPANHAIHYYISRYILEWDILK